VELPESRQNVLVTQEMGDRIIAGDDDVEDAWMGLSELPHVGPDEWHGERSPGGFLSRQLQLSGRDIRGRHLTAKLRQADALRADAAGGIEDATSVRAEVLANDAVQNLRMPEDALLPVAVQVAVEGGKPVVIGLDHRVDLTPS
jgi:hypothetical protein